MFFRSADARVRVGVLGALLAVISMIPAPAHAGIRSRGFGPAIDSTSYDGQDKCAPSEKPGVVAFRRMVLSQFPIFGYGGISRACHIGGQSEHKEGRAWDMSANAGYESHRKAVNRLFEMLLTEDRYGNEAALARRLGIMYMIWNRKIWGSWGGWDTYCVQKRRGCVDPEDGGLRHPHTDHVHFSFTWPGARKETTYYHRNRSMISGIAAHPSWGYWVLGRNGSVSPFEAGWYGSRADRFLDRPAVAQASTPSGYGYYLVTSDGRVFPFGDARKRGHIIKTGSPRIVDIEVTPSGRGYWLLAKSGRVYPFGDAKNHGGAKKHKATIAGMAATPTGLGYWLFATGGKVFAFGDAQALGGLAGKAGSPIIGGDNFGATGYWLATAGGRVAAFGEAQHLGDASAKTGGAPFVGVAANSLGTGYWLTTSKGRVRSFGKAPALGSVGADSLVTLRSVLTPSPASLGD